MKNLIISLILIMGLGCAMVKPTGDVIQTTSTMFGISLAQNQATQLYELKLGLIRNQITKIPTSKEKSGSNSVGSASDIAPFLSRTEAIQKSFIFGNSYVVTTIAAGTNAVGTEIGGKFIPSQTTASTNSNGSSLSLSTVESNIKKVIK